MDAAGVLAGAGAEVGVGSGSGVEVVRSKSMSTEPQDAINTKRRDKIAAVKSAARGRADAM